MLVVAVAAVGLVSVLLLGTLAFLFAAFHAPNDWYDKNRSVHAANQDKSRRGAMTRREFIPPVMCAVGAILVVAGLCFLIGLPQQFSLYPLCGLLGLALIVSSVFYDPSPKKIKARSQPAELLDGRLKVSSSHFMPYSVCPKCDTEALHWLEKPDKDWAVKEKVAYKRRLSAWERVCRPAPKGRRLTIAKPEMADSERLAVSILEGKVDVVRTCVNDKCGHRWGQQVGRYFDIPKLEETKGGSRK